MQILSAKSDEKLVEIANSYEASGLLEQSGCTAVFTVSHIDLRHYIEICDRI